MRLEHPKSGTIQQGALFNCALVPGYEECQCHGLILTARCDLEHGKYSVVNYLPVVRFSDWVNREMCYLLARRIHKSIHSYINKALRDKQVTAYVLDTFPLTDIIKKVANGKEQDTLLAKVSQLRVIEAVIELAGGRTSQCAELVTIDSKQCDTLIKELIQGKLPEYYFLNAVDVNDRTTEGYVVLLRNMRTLSTDHACRIAAGIEFDMEQPDPGLMSVLTATHDPACMITGVLRSPDIEHLAQYYANLFVRIGLEDQQEQIIEQHQTLAKG